MYFICLQLVYYMCHNELHHVSKVPWKKTVFSLYLFQTLIMISSSSSAHIFKDSKLNCTRCIFLLFVNVVPILLLAFFIVFFT